MILFRPIFFIVIGIFFTYGIAFAELIVNENFESGPNWKYSAPFTYESYLADEWDISTNGASGTYCVQSKTTGYLWIEDSTFTTSLPVSANEIFISFKFKASENLDTYWAQFMRFFGQAGGGGDLEIGMGVDYGTGDIKVNTGDINVFGTLSPVTTGWGDFTKSTSWTEYACYINYSENKFYFWKNPSSYTTSDPSFHSVSVNWQSYKYDRVLFPIYYKRDVQDSLFWLDDIVIRINELPNSTNLIPPSITNLTNN